MGSLRPAVVKKAVSDLARIPGSKFLQLVSVDRRGEGGTLDSDLLESLSASMGDPLLALGANFLTISKQNCLFSSSSSRSRLRFCCSSFFSNCGRRKEERENRKAEHHQTRRCFLLQVKGNVDCHGLDIKNQRGGRSCRSVFLNPGNF